MRRRVEQPDPFLDERLEPATDWLRRVRLRRRVREEWAAGADLDPAASRRSPPGSASPSCASPGCSPPAISEPHGRDRGSKPAITPARTLAAEALAIETARAGRIRDRIRRAAGQAVRRFSTLQNRRNPVAAMKPSDAASPVAG